MIEPKELMWGDWVRLVADNDNEVLQVNYVRRDGVGFKKYVVYFNEIEPIPLTAEILEKNGFKKLKAKKMNNEEKARELTKKLLIKFQEDITI